MRAMTHKVPLFLFILILWIGTLQSQEIREGSITYISRSQAYIDLGKQDGIQVGDSVKIYTGSEVLGTAIVSQRSGSSSALKPVSPTDITWSIGDQVKVRLNNPVSSEASVKSVETPADSIAPSREVFLDSAAFKPRTTNSITLDSEDFGPSFTGYLSSRITDRGGDTSGVRETMGSIYGQFKILDLGIRHLDVNTYLRSSKSSRDTLAQTRLYNLMVSYDNPTSRFSYLLGRLYHPQFSMLGTVDGFGVSFRSAQRRVAIAAGQVSNIQGLDHSLDRIKFGLIDEEHYRWGKAQIGYIGELESGELSRNYLLMGSTARLGSKFRIRGYGEFDLDLQDRSSQHSLISITRFRTSVNWRPWRSVISSSRYSYRENVIHLLDTSRSEYDRAARHAFNTNLSIMFGSGLTISTQASLRGDGNDRSIKMFGITMYHRNVSQYELSLNAGGMAMYSYLSEGGRIYASLGKDILPWFDVELYDEIFLYRILGEESFRVRHLPEISISAKVPGIQRLRFSTRFEHENDELLYRLSLSASRQF